MVEKKAVHEEREILGEEHVSGISQLLVNWLNPIMKRAAKNKKLEMDDLGELPNKHTAHLLHDKFQKIWNSLGPPRDLLHILMKLFGAKILASGILLFISDMSSIFTPLVLLFLFRHLENNGREFASKSGEYYAIGIGLCLMVFLLQIIQTLASNLFYRKTMQQGLQVRATLTSQITDKAMKLSPSARKTHNSGKITILISRDAPAVESSIPHLHLWWSNPVQCIIVAIMLYTIFGWSGVFGVFLLMSFIPIQILSSTRMSKLRKHTSQVSDQRQGLLQEIMYGLKTIKFKAWESIFASDLEDLRKREIGWLWKLHLSRQGINAWSSSFPLVATIITLAIYVFIAGGKLDPAQAIIALTLFNIVRQPIALTPIAVSTTSEGLAALKRLEEFLNSEELPSNNESPINDNNKSFAVKLKHARFSYSKTGKDFEIRVKDLIVPRGNLIAIVGPNGCGKSSLLLSLVGDTFLRSGEMKVDTKVALATQTPWLVKESIRKNILFDSPLIPERYQQVLKMCQLEEDLNRFPLGDETIVDVSTLSGGQRQRIGLARALYSSNNLLLLDDPVSALDVKIADSVCDAIISLKSRTRIVVTQHPKILTAADQVLVMNESGEIVAQGEYPQLHGLVETIVEEPMQPQISSPIPIEVIEDRRKTELALDDIRSQGTLSSQTITKFIKDSGGWKQIVVTMCLMGAQQTFRTLFDLWTNYWAYNTKNYTDEKYCGMALSFALLQGMAFFTGAVMFIYSGLKASRKFHGKAVDGILYSPMIQAMSLNIGSILNRFSYDQDIVDFSLPESFRAVTAMSFNVLSIMIVMIISSGWYVIPLGIFTLTVWLIVVYYRKTSRELARLLAMSRAPLQSHLSSSISGSTTIRAFRKESTILNASYRFIDFQNTAAYTQVMLPRWLELRISVLGNCVILIASLGFFFASSPSKSLGAVALVKALTITRVLFWLVRRAADTEVQMISVERIIHYQDLPREEQDEVGIDLGKEWPPSGLVDFKQVTVRYLPEHPPAVEDFSLTLPPKSHNVIMGRTGSGKSTLLLALFRLVPLETGHISIDGADISKINRRYLRQRLGIVPQEPFVFSSSIRRNLDPTESFSDDQLWQVLALVNLRRTVNDLGGLDSPQVKSLSLGQQQLLCLARAVLPGSKVVVLDEATSALDSESAMEIHRVLREGLKDLTVLAIAHRKEAFSDNDRIILMDKGHILSHQLQHPI
jgi:ABC-type multidrug transport system fused ATPase/permease subunit